MDVLRSSRFWIATIICVGATLMACLQLVTGSEALAVMTGTGMGFGLGKAGGDEQLTKVVTKAVEAAAPSNSPTSTPASTEEEKPDA